MTDLFFARIARRFAYSGIRNSITPYTIKRWLVGVIFVLAIAPLLGFVYTYTRGSESAHVQAATSSTLNFQARLQTNAGSLVADGNYTIQFKLYTAVTGGTNEWTETQTVSVKNGYLSAYLGSVTPFSGSIDWSQEKWLTMNVNGDGEMTPRMKLTAVPFAFRAGLADALSITGGTLSGDNILQKAPTSVQSLSSANAGLRFNQTGTGGLLQLQSDGLDILNVSKAGNMTLGGSLELGSGLRLGNSNSNTAGTIRWNGSDFEGFNGADWISLTQGSAPPAGGPANTSVSFVSGIQNQAANATNQLGLMVFTSNTAVSATNGTNNSFVAPTSGSFRACTMNNNANITSGTAQVRWRVNGATVGAGACVMTNATSDRRLSASTLDPGVVTFNAGDVIGVAVQSTGLAPTTLEFTVYWTIEYNSSATIPSDAFVQGGNTLGTTALLGTKDNYGLNFMTNNSVALSLSALGNATFMGDVSLSAGDLGVAGLVSATGFSGSGSGLTNLSASNIASGTLSDDRLSSNVALLDGTQTFTGNNTFTGNSTFGASTFGEGLVLGDSTSTTAGALRWNGSDFEGFNGISWVSLTSGGGNGASQSITVTKNTNEVVNNSAALQNDDELFFSIGANETWAFRFVVQANSGTTPDLRFAVTAPSGAVCRVGYIDPEGATSNGQYGCNVSTASIPGNGATDLYEITGTVQNGGTAGTVRLQWAQFTANASDTTVFAGSYLFASSGDTLAPGLQFMQGGNSFGSDAVLGSIDSNALRFITNGSERLTILANGNVGIGDTTPAALFTVGANDALQIDNAGNILTNGGLTVSGTISGATTNTINGLNINAGALSGVTGLTSSGNITFTNAGGNTITANSELILEQTGDTYGTTRLKLQNRFGANGAIFENTSLDLVDFGFRPSSGVQGNLRFERRASSLINGSNTSGEFQFLDDATGTASYTLAIGKSATTLNQGTLNIAAGGLELAGTSFVSNSRALSNVTGITFSSGGLDLSNGGITNAGALNGITGYSQASGAFSLTGTGNITIGGGSNVLVIDSDRFKVNSNGSMSINTTAGTAMQVMNGLTVYLTVASNGVRVGSSTADTTALLFMLDAKSTTGDPSGVNGGMYYNDADSANRCYQGGAWSDCSSTVVVGETTLTSASNTVTVNFNRTLKNVTCRISTLGGSAAHGVYMRFNGDTGGSSYGWNVIGSNGNSGATVTTNSDNSDSELQLSAATTSNNPMTGEVTITNASGTRKSVNWTLSFAPTPGTNQGIYTGGGVWNNTGQINSVSFITSTGTFTAGAHAWCEGRNVR